MRPGCPNLIERIEGGLFSYGNEFTIDNNPFECSLESRCLTDGSIDFTGLEALATIESNGIQRTIRGIRFDGEPCPPCASVWLVLAPDSNTRAGNITSAIWSPRTQSNVALGMIEKNYFYPGQRVRVDCVDTEYRQGVVTTLPIPVA